MRDNDGVEAVWMNWMDNERDVSEMDGGMSIVSGCFFLLPRFLGRIDVQHKVL